MSNYMGLNGLFGTSSSNSTNWMSGMTSIYSDYNTIRNGSYYKLLKAYYNRDSSTASNKGDSVSENTSTEKKELTQIKANSTQLKDSASALTVKGSKSLFEKKEIVTKDEAGNETKTLDYDREAIEKAVTAFVEDYNETIEAGADATSTNVLRKTLQLTQNTQANKNLLGKIGITVGKDNQLSLDKDVLQKARITDMKSLFEGRDSYAGRVSDKASQIATAAERNAAKKNALYTSTGNYYTRQNYSTLFDSLY